MDTQKKIREHISALIDGALPANDVELAFAALRSADGQHAWETYYRIGDVLRAQASPELSDGFAEKMAARLAAEPEPGSRRGNRATPDGASSGRRAPAGLNGGAPAAAAADGAELADAQSVVQPKPAIVTVS